MLARVAAVWLLAVASAPPAPTRWVTDAAGFLSADARAQLDARLEAHEKSSGQQVVVWVGGTTGGEPIEDFAERAFRTWRVGRAGRDDGVALFVMADDRRARIEVGYGLEERLPDAIAARLLAERFVPAMAAGNRDAAVAGVVDGILGRVAAAGPPAPEQPVGLPTLSWPQKIALIAAGLGLLVLAILNPRLFLQLLWVLTFFGRGRRRGSGGFSGHGGRSGGGGASSG